MQSNRNTLTIVLLVVVILLGGFYWYRTQQASVTDTGTTAAGGKQYGPGASDTEIKIGQTMPYSGPASAYGTIGKSEAAFFAMVNDKGGVNGRKINFVSLDDSYSPPKTVEQTRRLVEQEHVLLIFQSLGTPSNSAVRQYLNDNKVPQLFIATGADKWNDPSHFAWTMGWQPSYRVEARVYAKYIQKNIPDAKIGVLYQNDDFGKDYLAGLKDVFGADYDKLVVAAKSYEVTDPTVDSQIAALQASGANVFINVATPKFASLAIRKVFDIGWKPTEFLSNVSISVGGVLKPAGLDKSVGIITGEYGKDPTDPQWQGSQDYKDWLAWMQKYNSAGDVNSSFNVYGYTVAWNLVEVLKACGDNLTRENVMKQAASMNLTLPMQLPGMKITTSATDFAPIKQMQLAKFDGKTWALFGELLSGAGGPGS
jgi:branched-chain amino acid transport system substrate-binding protein